MTGVLLILLSVPQWPDSVPSIHLEFDQSQWEFACEHYWEDIYLPAVLTCGEYTLDCQFRIRGDTSREYPKKSIKIEFPSGVYLFDQNELNLNAEYLDKTRIRELVSYLYYSRTGQVVPRVHLVEVVFNGETQGAYVSVEDIDSDFLLNTSLPDEAVIYKCATRYATLDRVDELEPYSKKTHEFQPWDDLLLLMRWLALCPDDVFREQLQMRFYYDDLVSCVATNVLLGHGSTYYHNYHLLLDRTGATGPWRYVTWDMDRTWGMYGPEFAYHRNSSNDGNRRNTLIWRMWCNASIRADLIDEINSQYPQILSFAQSGLIDSLATAVSPLVEADPFRDFSMDWFWSDVDVVKAWPESRYANLTDQFSMWPLPFRMYPPLLSGSDLLVSWQTAGDGAAYHLVISPDSLFINPGDILFESFPGDTFHVVPGRYIDEDLWMQVFVTRNGTEDRSDNGPIRPLPDPGIPITGWMVISEINYESSPALNPGDWFEIVNAGDSEVSLAGWSVRDANPENLTTLGDLVIEPGECMVFSSEPFLFSGVFSTLPPPSSSLNFNLAGTGDRLTLLDPVNFCIDSLEYSSSYPWPAEASGTGSTLILTDIAADNANPASWTAGPFGGTPFTTGDWDPDWPAHGAVGMKALGPMPVTGNAVLQLTVLSSVRIDVSLYDITGRSVIQPLDQELDAGYYTLTLPTEDLPSGVYFAALRNMGFTETVKITLIGNQ